MIWQPCFRFCSNQNNLVNKNDWSFLRNNFFRIFLSKSFFFISKQENEKKNMEALQIFVQKILKSVFISVTHDLFWEQNYQNLQHTKKNASSNCWNGSLLSYFFNLKKIQNFETEFLQSIKINIFALIFSKYILNRKTFMVILKFYYKKNEFFVNQWAKRSKI